MTALSCGMTKRRKRQTAMRSAASVFAAGKLRLSQRPSFVFQKAVFRTLKGHLLQGERRSFGKWLIINELQTGCFLLFYIRHFVVLLSQNGSPGVQARILN